MNVYVFWDHVFYVIEIGMKFQNKIVYLCLLMPPKWNVIDKNA